MHSFQSGPDDFQGLVNGEKASEFLEENDLSASDLVAGKYEGTADSYRGCVP